MKTLLDDFYTSFLHAAIYNEGALRVIVAEGFLATELTKITITEDLFKEGYAIDTSEESRFAEVRFNSPIAWQLVDESFTSGDCYEVHEDDFALQVLTKSKYLDYVRANHGWFESIKKELGKHYRVWTQNEVIDVVTCEPPVVTLTSCSIVVESAGEKRHQIFSARGAATLSES